MQRLQTSTTMIIRSEIRHSDSAPFEMHQIWMETIANHLSIPSCSSIAWFRWKLTVFFFTKITNLFSKFEEKNRENYVNVEMLIRILIYFTGRSWKARRLQSEVEKSHHHHRSNDHCDSTKQQTQKYQLNINQQNWNIKILVRKK